MGGGLPAAAFGGRAEIMARLAPAGPVYQAGTLSGNPLACAAGLATLRLADDALYRSSTRRPPSWASWPSDALAAAGVPHRLSYAGNMFSIFFTDADVVDYDSARTQQVPRVQGVLPRDARRAASTCRRARSSRGSSRRRSTTPRWSTSPRRCRTAAHAAAAAGHGG